MPPRRCARCGRPYLPGYAPGSGVDPVLARRLCLPCLAKEERHARRNDPRRNRSLRPHPPGGGGSAALAARLGLPLLPLLPLGVPAEPKEEQQPEQRPTRRRVVIEG